jgi:adenylyltransferase/sulfurtransferase
MGGFMRGTQQTDSVMDLGRYSRQTVFARLGIRGQQKLSAAHAVIIGIGALGTAIANNLCRAGVGRLRLIDRDYVELSNLHRQTLFDEADAAKETPKAIAAGDHLAKINSEIALEPVIADVNSSNIEELIKDADVVLDGSDNLELRFLVNEACHKRRVPWVYGGVLGSAGNCMTVLPGGPCFRCLVPDIPAPGSYPTCSADGVLNMAVGIIASMESAEAVKIITGSPALNRRFFIVDVWNNTAEYLELQKDPDCAVCGHGEYELLGHLAESCAISLCGRDEYQVIPGRKTLIDFPEFAEKLRKAGSVSYSQFMLSFSNNRIGFNLFSDGRAIIKNVKDGRSARSVYSEYIGL